MGPYWQRWGMSPWDRAGIFFECRKINRSCSCKRASQVISGWCLHIIDTGNLKWSVFRSKFWNSFNFEAYFVTLFLRTHGFFYLCLEGRSLDWFLWFSASALVFFSFSLCRTRATITLPPFITCWWSAWNHIGAVFLWSRDSMPGSVGPAPLLNKQLPR